LKEQGAFISVSHPFDELRKGGWKEADLLEIIPHVDAIEVFNSRCMDPRFNHRRRHLRRNMISLGQLVQMPTERSRWGNLS
jgi:predicted metal-dependent phosphoesterase TrpH